MNCLKLKCCALFSPEKQKYFVNLKCSKNALLNTKDYQKKKKKKTAENYRNAQPYILGTPGVQKSQVNFYDIVCFVTNNCRLFSYDQIIQILFKFGTKIISSFLFLHN